MDMGMMSETEKRRLNLGSFFIGIAVGAIIGGGAALLFAPKSGRETRGLIKDKAVGTGHMLQDRANDVKNKAGQIGKIVRSRGQQEMETVK